MFICMYVWYDVHRSQYMREQGIMVIRCDNRGSYRRGLYFEGCVKNDMGNVEVKDQQAVALHYANKG